MSWHDPLLMAPVPHPAAPHSKVIAKRASKDARPSSRIACFEGELRSAPQHEGRSSSGRTHVLGRIVLIGTLALGLAGCFHPLYGPTASGVPLQDALASIEVEKATSPAGQERISHYVRSELIFDLDGSGIPHEKRYKLSLDTAESIQPISVDTTSGRADAALLNGTVKFELKDRANKTVLAGTARANAEYLRDQQRFASVRAARDADIRVGKLIADDIKQRLAAYMATAP